MPKPDSSGDAMGETFSPALADLSESALVGGTGVAAEMARFYGHRLRAYGSYLEKLAACRSLVDWSQLQALFFADAQRDYANEAAAIVAAATVTAPPEFVRSRLAPAP